jgi:hypothetical protein
MNHTPQGLTAVDEWKKGISPMQSSCTLKFLNKQNALTM